MRLGIISLLIAILACASVLGKGTAPAMAHPIYRMGKAPKPEFKVGGRSYKIDPGARNTKQVRALPPEQFDPITRPSRVEKFYRDTLKERYDESRHLRQINCGPFRREFIHWTRQWRADLRARWAWHHREYIDVMLWNEWMADPAFAAEIAVRQSEKTPVVIGYMPPEYEATSPVFIYNDEYVNAAYNPVPFMVVLKLKSLKPDEKTDWIGTAAADSLISKLSSVSGLFLAERDQVAGVLREQKLPESDIAEPNQAAQIGKALDVEQVVMGNYVVDGDKVLFNMRIVNVQTGAIQSSISKTVPRDNLLDYMPILASSMATAFGYESNDETSIEKQPNFPPQGTFAIEYSPGQKHTVVSIDQMSIRRRNDAGAFDTYTFQREADGGLSLSHSAGFEIWRIGQDGTIVIDRWKSKADRAKSAPLHGQLEPAK